MHVVLRIFCTAVSEPDPKVAIDGLSAAGVGTPDAEGHQMGFHVSMWVPPHETFVWPVGVYGIAMDCMARPWQRDVQ